MSEGSQKVIRAEKGSVEASQLVFAIFDIVLSLQNLVQWPRLHPTALRRVESTNLPQLVQQAGGGADVPPTAVLPAGA